jgi:hypothetical protein
MPSPVNPERRRPLEPPSILVPALVCIFTLLAAGGIAWAITP